MMTTGKLIIFSGPSGAGKTTLVQHILEKNPSLEFSISATTRQQREGEQEGVNYYFLTASEFEQKIKSGAFLEYEEVYPGLYYGTLHKELERIWKKNHHVIFDVDVKGGLNIKKHYPQRSLAIFVRPPSITALKERILKRTSHPPDNLTERLKRARQELEYEDEFDTTIVNNNLSPSLKEAENKVYQFLNES